MTTKCNGNCTAGNTPFRENKSICQIDLTIDPRGKIHLSFGTVKNLNTSGIKWVKMSGFTEAEKNLLPFNISVKY